ncbi:leucine-responsive transcriptional regulator Lrp [Echinimonas agarilytica]|uniref:Leucine-responsive regulatory protein n=1 Tax=Echinimonas agarilytica TaxID=1215918 RepID=A0AA41W8G0_9GAMM|nr:leucine-responsive transcriptional regulator Lrp [Echinimonas agarilytica]MCM2680761.1 leucine-responsive transcriptional regulator Lrp [Echinimonas agarilytica]
MPNKPLDRIDRKILTELQNNGRMSNVELSRCVGLSATPCLERVKRLEQQGVITGYQANIDPAKVGSSLLVIIEVTLDRSSPDVFEKFNKAVFQLDEILECYLVSGSFDYLMKTRVSDMSAYRAMLSHTLLKLPGVSDTRTYVVMEEVQAKTTLQIK